jgi:carbon storage regulator
MLVLSRKRGQSIIIAEQIKVTVLDVSGEQVRLGVEAPQELAVYREEIYEQIRAENITATTVNPEAMQRLQEALDEREKEKEKEKENKDE